VDIYTSSLPFTYPVLYGPQFPQVVAFRPGVNVASTTLSNNDFTLMSDIIKACTLAHIVCQSSHIAPLSPSSWSVLLSLDPFLLLPPLLFSSMLGARELEQRCRCLRELLQGVVFPVCWFLLTMYLQIL